MRKRTVVPKLFVLTAAVFALFLTVAILMQLLFFEKYYLHSKVNLLTEGVEEFVDQYTLGDWDVVSINRQRTLFENKYNAQMTIITPDGSEKYGDVLDIMLQLDDGTVVTARSGETDILDKLEQSREAGTDIIIEGILSESGLIIPFYIENAANKQVIYDENPGNYVSLVPLEGGGSIPGQGNAAIDTVKIRGSIIYTNFSRVAQENMPLSRQELWAGVDEWFYRLRTGQMVMIPGSISNYIFKDTKNGFESIMMVNPIYHNEDLEELVIVSSPMQPVTESVQVLKNYYYYIAVIAVLCIFLLSFFYSRFISRPLLELNRIAGKMARLDFTERSPVCSTDELGDLSQSLNHMSESLDRNIKNLKMANEKLKRDMDKEKKLELMRKELVSGVSHELRTPLSIIKGYAEVIYEGLPQEKRQHYIGVILEETDKMDALLADLLELSVLESGTYVIDISEFDLGQLIIATTEKFSRHLQEKEISLQCDLQRDIQVNADKRRIEQVLSNLLSNAVKNTDHGGSIRIRVCRKQEQAYVHIENTGKNIPAEQLQRIWEPFYRVDRARNRATGGAGLGLSIVNNILDLHASDFGVINIDNGVRFCFSLPISR